MLTLRRDLVVVGAASVIACGSLAGCIGGSMDDYPTVHYDIQEESGVAITDWRGVSATVKEGSVDSNGVKVVYHTVGEGPLWGRI